MLERFGYVAKDLIGIGGCSEVRMCQQTGNIMKLAIKITPKKNVDTPLKKERLNREIQILKKSSHQQILTYFDDFEDGDNFYLVTEYCDGITLYQYIKRYKIVKEENAIHIIRQLTSILIYLHHNKISHRDIKPENIIIDPATLKITLIDFGFATENFDSVTDKCGSSYYAAPEILSSTYFDPMKTDIWAVGIVFYIMLTGKHPFTSCNTKNVMEKASIGIYADPLNASKESINILRCCLQKDPKERGDIERLANACNITHIPHCMRLHPLCNRFSNPVRLSNPASKFHHKGDIKKIRV